MTFSFKSTIQIIILLIVQSIPFFFTNNAFVESLALIVSAIIALVFIIQSPDCFLWIQALKQQSRPKSITFAIFLGLVSGFLLYWLIVPAMANILNDTTFQPSIDKLKGNFKLLLLVFFTIGLTSGVCYEMVWRGFLQERFIQLFKNKYLAIAVAALFSALLALNGGVAIATGVFLYSFFIGYIYLIYRFNLMFVVIVHTFSDSLYFMALYLDLPTKLF